MMNFMFAWLLTGLVSVIAFIIIMYRLNHKSLREVSLAEIIVGIFFTIGGFVTLLAAIIILISFILSEYGDYRPFKKDKG